MRIGVLGSYVVGVNVVVAADPGAVGGGGQHLFI